MTDHEEQARIRAALAHVPLVTPAAPSGYAPRHDDQRGLAAQGSRTILLILAAIGMVPLIALSPLIFLAVADWMFAPM